LGCIFVVKTQKKDMLQGDWVVCSYHINELEFLNQHKIWNDNYTCDIRLVIGWENSLFDPTVKCPQPGHTPKEMRACVSLIACLFICMDNLLCDTL
jgi:hypothetical protein